MRYFLLDNIRLDMKNHDKRKQDKKYVVAIICLLGMLILSGKTENVFANDKKSKDMENSLLSFYIKDVSNVESIRYIPLDKKIIGNKRITDKSNVVDIGFGEYYIKVKDEKRNYKNQVIHLGMRHRKVACNFVKNYQ